VVPTKIEYVDESINPIRTKDGGWHCVKSSTGCLNCYAEGINKRFGDGKAYAQRDVKLVLNEKALEKPLKWKKPRRIFIQDMSDLFLPNMDKLFPDYIDSKYLCQIIDMIKETPQHTYIMLTKYPEEMKLLFMGHYFWHEPLHFENGEPLKNLWLGVTAENQEQADKRIPILLQIPAAVRFLSIEPMLGPVDLTKICLIKSDGGVNGSKPDITFNALTGWHGGANRPEKTKLDWIIAGGESGPKARPLHPNWARGVRDQCVGANVPFFFKQWGEWKPELQIEDGKRPLVRDWFKWGVLDKTGKFFPSTTPWNGKQGEYSDTSEYVMYKVGKKAAGRELSGKIWNEFPEVK
jgi:protein gp37